jgi:VanZ family protein
MNRRYLLLLIGYVSLVFFVSTRPGLQPPGPGFHMKDKLAHFIEYAILAGFLAGAFGGMVRSSRLGMFMFLLAIGATIGAVDETLQGYTPDRTMSVYDWFADVAGLAAVIGWVAVRRKAEHPPPAATESGGESR